MSTILMYEKHIPYNLYSYSLAEIYTFNLSIRQVLNLQKLKRYKFRGSKWIRLVTCSSQKYCNKYLVQLVVINRVKVEVFNPVQSDLALAHPITIQEVQ